MEDNNINNEVAENAQITDANVQATGEEISLANNNAIKIAGTEYNKLINVSPLNIHNLFSHII